MVVHNFFIESTYKQFGTRMLVERRNVWKSWSKNWAFKSRVRLLTPWFSTETPKKLHKPGTENHGLVKNRQTGYRCNRSAMDVYLRDLLFRLFDDCETNLSRRTRESTRFRLVRWDDSGSRAAIGCGADRKRHAWPGRIPALQHQLTSLLWKGWANPLVNNNDNELLNASRGVFQS